MASVIEFHYAVYCILHAISLFVVGMGGIIALVMLGYIQTTWNMSAEERKELHDYIEKNGFMSDPDDFF